MTVDHRDYFVPSLKTADVAEDLVTKWLLHNGYDAIHNPHTIAPSHDKWKDHKDSGDITVTLAGVEKRLEVKYKPDKKATFTSVDEFMYADMIVDEARKTGIHAPPMPLLAYAFVNVQMTGFLLLMADTQEHWYNKEIWDGRYEKDIDFTWCPKIHSTYHSLALPTERPKHIAEQDRIRNQSNEEWLIDFCKIPSHKNIILDIA